MYRNELQEILGGIKAPDRRIYEAAKQKWDRIAKPLGSLGIFEDMIAEMAALKEDVDFKLEKPVLTVFCADNGVVAEGVSQTGQEVTLSVMKALAADESTVSFMARDTGCAVIPVDVGVRLSEKSGDLAERSENGAERALPGSFSAEDELRELMDIFEYDRNGTAAGKHRILNRRILNGTEDIFKGPAMPEGACEDALLAGVELVRELKGAGADLILTGEMGIGNTTTSAAVATVLTGEPAERFVGRGAGLPSDRLARKLRVVKEAIRKNQPDKNDVVDVLAKVGGLDIAALTGVFLGGAYYGVPVVIDGYISSVAALCAGRLSEYAGKAMFASHCTLESGGDLLLKSIGKRAVINADMHLGEGGGAIMLLPLLRSALNVYNSGHDFDKLGIEAYKRYEEGSADA